MPLSYCRPIPCPPQAWSRFLATNASKGSQLSGQDRSMSEVASASAASKSTQSSAASKASSSENLKASSIPPNPSNFAPADWEENPNFSISQFSELPHSDFGVNQHMIINNEFKEALRQILWQFRAPIRYAFAYGSGVFPQSKPGSSSPSSIPSIHPKPPAAVAKAQGGTPKMIDFIFGVSHTQHWHSLNLMQHRDHYSAWCSISRSRQVGCWCLLQHLCDSQWDLDQIRGGQS